MFYEHGQRRAWTELGLQKEATAKLLMRARPSPFNDFHKKIERAFRLKTPKFDMSALMKRLLNNPFKQPRAQLGGKFPVLRV